MNYTVDEIKLQAANVYGFDRRIKETALPRTPAPSAHVLILMVLVELARINKRLDALEGDGK